MIFRIMVFYDGGDHWLADGARITGARRTAPKWIVSWRSPCATSQASISAGIGRRQLGRSMQPRQTGCIPPIRLHPVADFARDQRRRHHVAAVLQPRECRFNSVSVLLIHKSC